MLINIDKNQQVLTLLLKLMFTTLVHYLCPKLVSLIIFITLVRSFCLHFCSKFRQICSKLLFRYFAHNFYSQLIFTTFVHNSSLQIILKTFVNKFGLKLLFNILVQLWFKNFFHNTCSKL